MSKSRFLGEMAKRFGTFPKSLIVKERKGIG